MSKRQQASGRRFLGSKQGLLFLMFAGVIWLLSTLSETYTAAVPVYVVFEEDTSDFLLLSDRVDIPVRVSGTGFSIVYQKLFPQKIRFLTSDLPLLDVNNPVVDAAIFQKLFTKQRSSAVTYLGVDVDTIMLPIAVSAQKTFSPVLLYPPSLAEGYQLTSPLQLSVDSVSVYGSQNALEKLDEAIFVLEQTENIKTDVELQAKLVDSLAATGKWSTTTLSVSAKVDRYSDVSFVLPVTLINAPATSSITVTPNQVTVKFAAPLTEIRTLTATNLRAEVDFKPNASGQLLVKIVGVSSLVKQLVVEPSLVNYFIVE